MFPVWSLIAIGGHVANATAFIIDKSLLTSSFKRPATYAGTVGLLGILALVLIPFGVHLPTGMGWIWIILSGTSFVLALWTFFSALSQGETTRIVPIIGSLIPVLTLVGTFCFLEEHLNHKQLLGFALLIIATMILAGGGAKERLSKRAVMIAVLSAMLFAFSSVTVKLAYETEGFLTSFAISRVIGCFTAVGILLADPKALTEVRRILLPSGSGKKKTDRASRKAGILVLVGQSLGAGGFVLVQYAISLGSAAIVNALQAVQYAFLVAVALLFGKKAARLLGENLSRPVIIRKMIAICIVAFGLWSVV